MDKTAIKNFAIEARKILMKTAISEAGFYGITKDECKAPLQKGNDFEVYETLAGTENRIFGDDIKRRANLVNAINELGFDQVIEETAYTWFNRIIAIRFMEVNNYLPTKVRVLSSETGNNAPDIISQADTVELNLTPDELEAIQTAKRENRYDDAFRLLFIKQCNELNAILPGLFEKTDDYMELLLKITYTSDGVVRMLIDSIPEDNFNVKTEGQVEIIGWMYQYYNTELKDDTFAKLKKNVKITKERIPAATQLFTPDWIVRYMVENSLGRVWIEHLRAINPDLDEKAVAEDFGWKYYLPEAEQEADVAAQLVDIRSSYKDMTPQDITCIDPCMGSGHILVYMFDVLMDIYRSEGFSERDSVFDILEKNIRGLDIDRRAYQLSYFALMMKARGYNRIFFRGHEDLDGNRVQANPKVYAIEESNSIDRNQLSYYGSGLNEVQKNTALEQMNELLDSFTDAKVYGSIIKISDYDWELLSKFINELDDGGQMSLSSFVAGQSQTLLLKMIQIGKLISSKYDAVITNPPYMGAGGMPSKIVEYLKVYYPLSKSDLFAAFIERGFSYAKSFGFNAMVTMQSWMFLTSYEKMRNSILDSKSVSSLIHMDNMVMGIAFGTAAFSIRNSKIKAYKGIYNYISMKDIENDSPKEFPVLDNRYSKVSSERFLNIPGRPIAYWISDSLINIFNTAKALGDIAPTKKGLDTGENAKYLRLWFEVDREKLGYGYKSSQSFSADNKKWAPHDKGGDFRRWYGNKEWVINWENNGYELHHSKANLRSEKFYFSDAITWGSLSSGNINFRLSDYGAISNTAGSSLYPDLDDIYYLAAILNSKVTQYILDIISPTINYSAGPVSQIPIIDLGECKSEIVDLAKSCIEISREDWNETEKSWEFQRNPLIGLSNSIEEAYNYYHKIQLKRHENIKDNEIQLNRILIDKYGLKNEVEPSVEDKEIAIRVLDRKKAMKELISYAVGCMFGRYSLANGGMSSVNNNKAIMDEKYYSADAIIPITEENYNGDIVSRFIEFIEAAFGKEKIEENMDYIAKSLDKSSKNSIDTIRQYFLNDFYSDHCNTFTVSGAGKRPIYWLFSSGDDNGFKCLIYYHRYYPDMIGVIRSDYLVGIQNMISNLLKNVDFIIKNTKSEVDKAQATNKQGKYLKQLAEIKAYYPALSHVALQRIELDLDDGVKTNYAKFQGIEVSIEGEKNRTVDLLAKI